MNTSVQAMPPIAANTKPLWAAVGVLGFAVLAMGASLVYVQTRPADGHVAMAALAPSPQTETVGSARIPVAESLQTQEDLVAPPLKPEVLLVKPAPVKPQPKPRPVTAVPGPVASVATPAPAAAAAAPTTAPAPAAATAAGAGAGGQTPALGTPSVVTNSGLIVSQPIQAPAKPVCANCGSVESVTPVQRNSSGSGVGAVAGGALGAVVGHQIGKGSGRTVATILGAIGGGVAGNTVEKNVKEETLYQVHVRMEDGSTRTVEQASLPAVGSKVTVDGGVLHSADGSGAAPPAAKPLPQARNQPAPEHS